MPTRTEIILRLIVFAALLCVVVFGMERTAAERFDRQSAQSVIEGFMAARLNRDGAMARAFLSNDLHGQLASADDQAMLIGRADPHYADYEIVEMSRDSKGVWRAWVRVAEESLGSEEPAWFVEEIMLIPIGGSYRIGDLRRGPSHSMDAASW